ncbi:MAG: NAD(P)-dependent oxidoreductase [[Ruminococcus] torques]
MKIASIVSLFRRCFIFCGPVSLCLPGASLLLLKKEAAENNVAVFDYADDISLPVYNSISTAEGAICEAILHSPFNLHKSRCAVLGFGKCGHSIVYRLKGLSANVSVFTDNAEESARASVIADKSFPLKSLSDHAGDFRFIFNTVPAQFINEETLKNVDLSALIIDIASSPGGVDYDAAQRLGISALHCLGLPGKYAPASSARHLKQFIESKLYLS